LISLRQLLCAAAGVAGMMCVACAAAVPADAPPRLARADVRLAAETETIEALVPRNATLDSLLRAQHIQQSLVVGVVGAARTVFDPRQIRSGRPYRLVRSLDGLLSEFVYEIDADRFLRVAAPDREHPDALDAKVLPFDKQIDVALVDARIEKGAPSLIAAIERAGENIQLALGLADVFSGQVDFNTELQPGDRFRVLVEKSTRDGQFSSYGAIVGASLVVDGHTVQGFRWVDPATGKAGYYDEHGRSLQRFFLKSPLKFEPRITSRFSQHRLHPIDNVVKPHLGVDFAAPAGSSVVAVAAGTVVSASFSGGSGNMVHLKHAGGFETFYLHLSSFGPGVRAGTHVAQGQIVGRVGMTGSATGPHLDYRLKREGVFVNPVSFHARQAPGEPISAALLPVFATARDASLSRLNPTLLAAAGPSPKPDAIH
jgi:murein DD-endopeptidase MepM/ murein hydrolase activator NlpD